MTLPRTPSQTVGPFFSFGLTERPGSELVAPGTPGAIEITGAVVDGGGVGVPDAMVEIWQADEHGARREGFGWGRSGTDADGGFRFVTVKPGSTGDKAPHLDVLVFARGMLKPALTRMYFPDEEAANAADPVLSALPDPAAAPRLVARPADGGLRFDVRLQGDEQTPFFAF